MKFRKTSMFWRVLLALVLIVGVGFRFYNLDKKVFWMDEATSATWVAGYSSPKVYDEMRRQRIWSPEQTAKFQHLTPGRSVADSVMAQADEDPKHPPLFYALLRIWAGIFGDSVFALRLLPAVLSLLVFPALWCLCRELFRDEPNVDRISMVALALMALSPFHVLYAQEAREYSLWTAVLLASSALLLRALRLGSLQLWLLYAFVLAIGLYTHTLSLLLWVAHGAYVLALCWQDRQTSGGWLPAGRKKLLPFAGACGFAILLFLPWAFLIWQRQSELSSNTSWVSQPSSPWYVMKTWVLIFSVPYFDPDNSRQWAQSSSAVIVLAARITRCIVFALLLYALGTVWRHASRKVALFICLMAIVPFAALALPDLLVDGYRSTIGRFMIPSFLAIQLAVVYLIAGRTEMPQAQWRRNTVFGALLLSGFFSCVLNSQAEVWWNKTASTEVPAVSRILNAQRQPLIVTEAGMNALSLSRLLKSHTRLYFVNENDEINFDSRRLVAGRENNDVFFFRPSKSLRSFLQSQDITLRKVNPRYDLWQFDQEKPL